MTDLKYIDLTQSDVKPDGYERTSSLLVMSSTKRGGSDLQVIGELPHSYRFEPKSVNDAKRLRVWLTNWINAQH